MFIKTHHYSNVTAKSLLLLDFCCCLMLVPLAGPGWPITLFFIQWKQINKLETDTFVVLEKDSFLFPNSNLSGKERKCTEIVKIVDLQAQLCMLVHPLFSIFTTLLVYNLRQLGNTRCPPDSDAAPLSVSVAY